MKEVFSWDKSIQEKVIHNLSLTFQKTPKRFFTEHDIHSYLYRIVEDELGKIGVSFFKTRDGYLAGLVHHEYPTPFRCDMRKYEFRVAGEEERTPRKGLYKRGHYDLVIFNPDFISQNNLIVVTGKNYQLLRKAMEHVKTTPLLWVCEIVFLHQAVKIPKNAIRIIRQDGLKVKATLDHKVGQNISFCKAGSFLVFSTLYEDKTMDLRQEISNLENEHQMEITFITASSQ
jgi:hypothetical protein